MSSNWISCFDTVKSSWSGSDIIISACYMFGRIFVPISILVVRKFCAFLLSRSNKCRRMFVPKDIFVLFDVRRSRACTEKGILRYSVTFKVRLGPTMLLDTSNLGAQVLRIHVILLTISSGPSNPCRHITGT